MHPEHLSLIDRDKNSGSMCPAVQCVDIRVVEAEVLELLAFPAGIGLEADASGGTVDSRSKKYSRILDRFCSMLSEQMDAIKPSSSSKASLGQGPIIGQRAVGIEENPCPSAPPAAENSHSKLTT